MILHIDFNSYFATVEQQANPRLRGKPIGVTGGDRLERTVIGAASVEAKALGIRTGMPAWEARQIAPDLILVKGDSAKYLSCTKKFLNILSRYTPYVEVFSIDEAFLEIRHPKDKSFDEHNSLSEEMCLEGLKIAENIKQQISTEVGDWVRCSTGVSYSRIMAKLAGSMYKPNGLVVLADPESAMMVLDHRELDDVCGIGYRTKRKLNNMGVFDFKHLREVPIENLFSSFKSYGQVLYDLARGIDHTSVIPFYEKEGIKSVGHRHTLSHNTDDPVEVKQNLLKLSELVARRLRSKKLIGKTVHFGYRSADMYGSSMQSTLPIYSDDGLEIFNAAWDSFQKLWQGEDVRMVGVSVSNLQPKAHQNLTFLEDSLRTERITKALDKINNKFGEFTLKRAILIGSDNVRRMPNPFLADYRFKI